eukprot:4936694-Pleurochrysis_carterae.AAC.1
MLGNGRLEAFCFDGVNRLCHIRGKLRKRVWIGVVRASVDRRSVRAHPTTQACRASRAPREAGAGGGRERRDVYSGGRGWGAGSSVFWAGGRGEGIEIEQGGPVKSLMLLLRTSGR